MWETQNFAPKDDESKPSGGSKIKSKDDISEEDEGGDEGLRR